MISASRWPLFNKIFLLEIAPEILRYNPDQSPCRCLPDFRSKKSVFWRFFHFSDQKKIEKQIKPTNSEKIFKFFLIDNKFRLQVLRIQKNKLAQKMLTVRKSVRFSSFVTAQATSLLCVSDSLSIDHWALSRLISPHPKRVLLV